MRQGVEYQTTTSSSNHANWPWYREFCRRMDELQRNDWKDSSLIAKSGPLPVSLCREYCAWIMQTPEVRDIIYRRFIQKDFDNDLEKRLLISSSMYFVMERGYDAEYSTFLSSCWLISERMIKGELASFDDGEEERLLLLHPNFFRPN
jgi:hypothetical protein